MMDIKTAKKTIKKGMKIRLLSHIDDPYTPKDAGDIFVASGFVDDSGNIHGYWEKGGSISIICDQDEFEIIKEA